MSTQQEAQERAEKLLDQDCMLTKGGFQYTHCRHYFIKGEASGERITLERLAAKSSEGYDDWWNVYSCEQPYKGLKYDASEAWQARGTPLLAKIELQDKRIAELEKNLPRDQWENLSREQYIGLKARIAELEAENKSLASQAIRISNKAGEIKGDLEAQNKKLGDVVLEMAASLEHYGSRMDSGATARRPLKYRADLIKQLKQERGCEPML